MATRAETRRLYTKGKIMIRTIASALLALSFVAGASGVMAAENDNNRDTHNAKQFYEKLQQEQGGGN
jgi:hypothetical protein